MALSTKEAWETFLKDAGIPKEESSEYAQTFQENRIRHPSDLSKDILKELDIRVIGDQIAIMKHAQTTGSRAEKPSSQKSHFKPQIPLPQITAEMTPAEFRKFKRDWSVYKSITQIPPNQLVPQLYTACDSVVQNCIINTDDDFLSLDETATSVNRDISHKSIKSSRPPACFQ